MSTDTLNLERLRADPEYEITRVCKIDDMSWDGVGTALQMTPALITFANVKFRLAKHAATAAQHRYEEEKTRAFARHREDGAAIGVAKETCELDEDVLALKRQYLEADREASMWYALVKGLESRMDALQQISSRQKMEMSKNWRYANPPAEPREE